MSIALTAHNINCYGETRDVSVTFSNNLIAVYNRAAAIGDEHCEKYACDAIDEAIVDEICAVFDISDDDRENIDFVSEFINLFNVIYTQICDLDYTL